MAKKKHCVFSIVAFAWKVNYSIKCFAHRNISIANLLSGPAFSSLEESTFSKILTNGQKRISS